MSPTVSVGSVDLQIQSNDTAPIETVSSVNPLETLAIVEDTKPVEDCISLTEGFYEQISDDGQYEFNIYSYSQFLKI